MTTPDPFFIVGCPRSGTTLLQLMLDAHPAIAVTPETFFVRSVWERRGELGDLGDPSSRARTVDALFAAANMDNVGVRREAVLSRISPDADHPDVLRAFLAEFAAANDARLVGEKTPNHLLSMPLLQSWFPGARFVHVVRDPRAVVASWRKVPWSTGTVEGDAAVWARYLRTAREHPPDGGSLLTVRYEDLVARPEQEIRTVLDFLGVSFDDAVLRPQDRSDRIDAATEPWKRRSGGPLDPGRDAALLAELTPDERARIDAVVLAEAARWGYPPASGVARRVAVRAAAGTVRAAHKVRPRPAGTPPLAPVAFLHVGPPRHGVVRFGSLTADAVRLVVDGVTEIDATSDTGGPSLGSLARAVRRARHGRVIQLQYQAAVWGPGLLGLVRILAARVLSWPRPWIVTVHDVYDRPVRGRRARAAAFRRHPRRYVARAVDRWTLLAIRLMASVVVVMSEEERDRFRRRARGDAVVIRHPVEHMPTQDTPPVNDPRVLSVLGFVHRRKGPELLIQAAARLDTPSRVALLGALADPSFENDLAATAAGAAMSDRVEITGFLPSDVLVDRILGTDVAVCAYVDIAASSSLATWLASRVPVVAYASRYVVELDAIAPGAIAVFHTYSADALAAALGSVLGEGPAERRDRRSAMDRLAEALAPPVIGAAYAELYRKVSSERRRWRSITGANASGG